MFSDQQKYLILSSMILAGCAREQENINITAQDVLGYWRIVECPRSLQNQLGAQEVGITFGADDKACYTNLPIKHVSVSSLSTPSYWYTESGKGVWVLADVGTKEEHNWQIAFSASKVGVNFRVSRSKRGRLSIKHRPDVRTDEIVRFEKQ